ncbi:tartrate-resistant acid phosphatase type 5-like [Pomacea canaliculata]|uniref:tartrate-resistant acid phosphatase type 5-like n=1 Tax=Pomacea canaliculata TaxID=400727 RepID=UPI000D73D680|nr:tartrate-resistant acid phosphatase type 5-like [Pomacea canaliculata]
MARVTTSAFVFLLCVAGCLAVDSLRFLVIGDMGGLPTWPYTTFVEVGTAEEMGKIADLYSPQFVLELGDNFYYDGVKNVQDKRFEVTFENVYKADSLKKIPWYLVAGNHDHNGNVSAQIAYSKVSQRWNFPDYYYPLSFAIPNTNTSLDIVMMDTVLLCGNSGYDSAHTQPTGPEDKIKADEQWEFIQKSLQGSKAMYLFTAGHFPVYSVAEHGPTDCLVSQLLPLLYKTHASGHMCGHDHNLQHLQTAEAGITLDFILSGSANFIDESMAHETAVPPGSLKFHWADITKLGGFVYAEATSKNMTITYMEANGKILYKTTVFPRKV